MPCVGDSVKFNASLLFREKKRSIRAGKNAMQKCTFREKKNCKLTVVAHYWVD